MMEEPSKGTKLGKRSPCVHDMHLLLNFDDKSSEFGSILSNLWTNQLALARSKASPFLLHMS